MVRPAEPPPRQRLILRVAADVAPAALTAALEAGDVAAVVVAAGPETTALVDRAQREGVAALVGFDASAGGAPPWPLGYGADGVHVIGDEAAAATVIATRPEGASIGAEARTRHGAMTLGEAGADYLWFGSTAALDEEMMELACWWQALFEVPAVAAGPADLAAVRTLIAMRVEFIAVNVFDVADPVAFVEAVNRALNVESEFG